MEQSEDYKIALAIANGNILVLQSALEKQEKKICELSQTIYEMQSSNQLCKEIIMREMSLRELIRFKLKR